MDKRLCHSRAKELLLSPTAENLRYAALELRLCMEILTYEKLRSYSKSIPESVLKTWQPPQAVKALLEFEDDADKSFTLYAGIEKEYGKPSENMKFVGQHNALNLKWLRKHYNKIGNLLHAPSVGSAELSLSEIESYISEVITDLELPLAGTILGGGLRNVFSVSCSQCGNNVVCNQKNVENSHKAVCFNPQCKAEYYVNIGDDGNPRFQLMATDFDCIKCKSIIWVENRKIDIGFKFSCSSCGQEHIIVSRQWEYADMNNP